MLTTFQLVSLEEYDNDKIRNNHHFVTISGLPGYAPFKLNLYEGQNYIQVASDWIVTNSKNTIIGITNNQNEVLLIVKNYDSID